MSLKPFLSFHTCDVYPRDAALVGGCQWFNDAVIHFVFDYLENDGEVVRAAAAAPVRFVSPQSSHLLLHEDDVDDFRDAMIPILRWSRDDDVPSDYAAAFAATSAVFAVNDNTNHAQGGGSHWTALVWLGSARTFVFLDSGVSQSGRARGCALALARKLTVHVLGAPADSLRDAGEAKTVPVPETATSSAVTFWSPVVPQQNNTYDCGAFVSLYARVVAGAAKAAGAAPAPAALVDTVRAQAQQKDATATRGWIKEAMNEVRGKMEKE